MRCASLVSLLGCYINVKYLENKFDFKFLSVLTYLKTKQTVSEKCYVRFFIFPTDRIIQLTRKLMYNDITEQNLKTCMLAIIIVVFTLTKNPQKDSNLKN